jgi:hypothetical protein
MLDPPLRLAIKGYASDGSMSTEENHADRLRVAPYGKATEIDATRVASGFPPDCMPSGHLLPADQDRDFPAQKVEHLQAHIVGL